MEQWLVLGAAMLLSGCIAGILAGLFGIGGGIVMVPVLELLLTFLNVDAAIRMHVAVATSLAVIVPTSIASARAHLARQSVDLEIARSWGIFVLCGAAAGTWLAAQLHSQALALMFATLALLIALRMIVLPETRGLVHDIPANPLVKSIPLTIGGLSAMMGIGGGTFSVLVLTLFGRPIHRAVGTAALLGLFIAIPATLGFVIAGWQDARLPAGSVGFVSVIGFVCLAPMTVLCAPLGARLAHTFAPRQLSVLFGLFLVIAAARMFYGAIQ